MTFLFRGLQPQRDQSLRWEADEVSGHSGLYFGIKEPPEPLVHAMGVDRRGVLRSGKAPMSLLNNFGHAAPGLRRR